VNTLILKKRKIRLIRKEINSTLNNHVCQNGGNMVNDIDSGISDHIPPLFFA